MYFVKLLIKMILTNKQHVMQPIPGQNTQQELTIFKILRIVHASFEKQTG